jgi:hypothetical protein
MLERILGDDYEDREREAEIRRMIQEEEDH